MPSPAPSSWLHLAHHTAIVTGAGSGIGSVVAQALAEQGCRVLVADSNGSAAEKVADAIRSRWAAGGGAEDVPTTFGRRARPVVCDVTDPQQVRALIRDADAVAARTSSALIELEGARGELSSSSLQRDVFEPPPVASILVNCAGITRDSLLPNMQVEDFDRVVDVNLKGTWLTCKYFCSESRLAALQSHKRDMLERIASQQEVEGNDEVQNIGGGGGVAAAGGASIINVGSVVSKTGNIGQTNYGASKGGVVGLTRSLAKEAARYGVRANVILPGFVDTPMSQAVPERIRDNIRRKIPLGTFGSPEDVANLALFLASCERSGYITGESIECSGMIAL